MLRERAGCFLLAFRRIIGNTVAAVLYPTPPALVVQIPLHGLAQPAFKGFLRLPAQFAADFARVHRISHIVPGAVGNVGDQIVVMGGVRRFVAGRKFLQQVANGMDNINIPPLAVAADVVGFADGAAHQHAIERARVVIDIQPVTDLPPVAVHGQRPAGKRVQNHVRNEFFGELAAAVIVGTVGDQGGQAVGALPGADEVVAAGLAGGIGAGGRVGRGFGEFIGAVVAQVAVHFVGGNVVEAEAGAFGFGQRLPVMPHGFEQCERSDQVGADEVARIGNAFIDMAFGSQMHHGVRAVAGENAVEAAAAGNIGAFKRIVQAALDMTEAYSSSITVSKTV